MVVELSDIKWSKTSIIHSIVRYAGLTISEKNTKEYLHAWWHNPCNDIRGFRLTESGLNAFKKVNITAFVIEFPEETKYTSQLVLRLDNFITCPYYLERKRITVFDENIAVQLVLFSGDLKKYTQARIDSSSGS